MKESIAGDVDRLMKWFPDEQSIKVWGGPGFRYPFTRHSFAEDMHWGKMASYRLSDPDGEFAAFGQFYERLGCINLARLVANPDMRGKGVGKRLVGGLIQAGRPLFSCSKF
jgi:GNAT superfamily N-acetyltransferase